MQERNQYCLNCNTPLDNTETYCSNCGQNKLAVDLSIKQIVQDAFATFFNLDSRLFHTVKDIFRPYKLTRTYVEGKRRYYVNPAKLFLFSLISLISVFLIFGEVNDNDLNNDELATEAAELKISRSFDSIAQTLSPNYELLLDTIRAELFKDTSITDELFVFDAKLFGINLSSFKFTKTDMVTLTVDEMLEKYELNSFKERLLVGQFLHFLKDTSGGIRFIIKNFTYVILLLVFLAAMVLKLLHFRRPFFFVEHLVLLLYGHVLLFVLIVPTLFENILGINGNYFALACGFSILLFQFISFKKYYRQGGFKTLIKMIAFNIAYLFLFLCCSIIVSLISLLIF